MYFPREREPEMTDLFTELLKYHEILAFGSDDPLDHETVVSAHEALLTVYR